MGNRWKDCIFHAKRGGGSENIIKIKFREDTVCLRNRKGKFNSIVGDEHENIKV